MGFIRVVGLWGFRAFGSGPGFCGRWIQRCLGYFGVSGLMYFVMFVSCLLCQKQHQHRQQPAVATAQTFLDKRFM